jgi:Temperature dependent protein affecting M2 dsRNA replication
MINSFEGFLRAQNLTHTVPLSTIKDARLGIDLALYLRSLLSSPETSEPYVGALGGSPLALISHIENDLHVLDKAKVKPVFVLGGILPSRRGKPILADDPRTDQRRLAWECYERGDVDGTIRHLGRSGSVQVPDLVRAVLRAFRHRNVEFLVAPYLAEGQLVYLERHSKSYVHAIYGTTETFLFDRVDKVILSLNLRNTPEPTFTFASKSEIMGALRCSEEEFLDMGLLLGFEHCPTFPPLTDGTIPNPSPKPLANGTTTALIGLPNPVQALETVRQHRSGFTACQTFSDHAGCLKLNYVEAFCRARCLIKFCLVMSAEEGRVLPLSLATPPPPIPGASLNGGHVAPGVNGTTPPTAPTTGGAPILSTSDVPSDLHEIFSNRLPDELFLHVSRGLLSPSILNNLVSGTVVELAPLDEGDSEDWRQFVKYTLVESPQSPRCVALALLCDSLSPFWSSRKISAHYHFEKGQTGHNIAIESNNTQTLVKRVDQWNVNFLYIEEELRRQVSSTIDIALCLGATGRADQAEQTKTPRPDAKKDDQKSGSSTAKKVKPATATVLEKKDEIVANVIWRFLEMRGFLNYDHLHTPYARALHLSIRSSRLNDKFQEPLYLALELIRANILHDQPYKSHLTKEPIIKSGGPTWGDLDSTDAEEREIVQKSRKHLLLIMRSLSILPMNYKTQAWKAPLSRELLQFNSFLKALSKNLRSLVEVIASTMLLKGGTYIKRDRDDYLDISLSLPFQTVTSTGLGIVVKCYLEALLTFNNGVVEAGKEDDADVVEAREAVLGMLETTFSNIKDVRGEIARGFRFWSAIIQAINILEKEKSISAELVQQFKKADTWLAPMTKI